MTLPDSIGRDARPEVSQKNHLIGTTPDAVT